MILRRIILSIGFVFLFAGGVFAQGGETRMVDFRADFIRPVKIGDTSAMTLVGNVVLFHNGAVITCDSVVRYSATLMDCFKNVIINKDSTYIYGDQANYNGDINTARVYAPLIKMVDKDATLYTYNFSFNTLEDIGRYSGGGTMSQKENMLESRDGYYYSAKREMVCVGDVQMRNEDYTMKSDSVSYSLDTEVARFFTRSYIWNKDNEIVSALNGEYDTKNDKFYLTDSTYILTATQEVWSDTLNYHTPSKDAILINNVQIRDDEQNAMAFGDYVQYWGEIEKVLLTRNPAVLNFDPQEPDTLYMRADSMFVFTIKAVDSLALGLDSLSSDDLRLADSLQRIDSLQPTDSLAIAPQNLSGQAILPGVTGDTPELPGMRANADTDANVEEDNNPDAAVNAEPAPVPLTAKEIKKAEAEKKRQERDAKYKAQRQEKEAKYKAQLLEREAKIKARELAQAAKRGETLADDDHHHDHEGHDHAADSLAAVDSVALAAVADTTLNITTTESAAAKTDSISREVRAYNNVRIFRSDFQAVCDSLVGFSIDSTMYMYNNPVLWNENNQIKSEFVQIQTKNQKIENAYFTGDPIMSSKVDSIHFNQVKGRTLEAFFVNGAIDRMEAVGNGQTYYFMEDGDSTDRYISGMFVVESASITFRFEDQKMTEIAWIEEPIYDIYPIDKIPEWQALTLPGFVWVEDRRPSQEDVFTRAILPSEREFHESLPRPLYVITSGIEKDKKLLIEAGSWFDRNDRVSPDAREFIRSLGY